MRIWLSAIAASLACMNADGAEARLWPQTGGWDVGQSSEDCAISQTYEGEGSTLVLLMLKADGSVWLGVSNYNWSTVERQAYPLSYVVDGTSFSGGNSVGYRSGIRKGFLARFPAAFLDHFARGSGLAIYNGTSLVDDLSLAGTGAAVQVLRRCIGVVRAERAAAERERARLSHIPRDPFAAAPLPARADRPAGGRPSQGRANLASYFSTDDYPAAALRAGEQGTTEFRLTVGTNGRVTDCVVTRSSGSESLDQATCRIMRSRARFTPARDASGTPVPDSVDARLNWTLPHDAPAPGPATVQPQL